MINCHCLLRCFAFQSHNRTIYLFIFYSDNRTNVHNDGQHETLQRGKIIIQKRGRGLQEVALFYDKLSSAFQRLLKILEATDRAEAAASTDTSRVISVPVCLRTAGNKLMIVLRCAFGLTVGGATQIILLLYCYSLTF